MSLMFPAFRALRGGEFGLSFLPKLWPFRAYYFWRNIDNYNP